VERRVNEERTNRIASILGLPPPFPPPPPPEQLWRISKLREWSGIRVSARKRKTPTPFCEIRVFVYTFHPESAEWSDVSLDRALDAVEQQLPTLSTLHSYKTTNAKEEEDVDDDELVSENRVRGVVDAVRVDELWYYVAFYKGGPIPEITNQYYGRVRGFPLWNADDPVEAMVSLRPRFGTPFVAVWSPNAP